AQHRSPRRGRRPCPCVRNRARLGRMLWTAQLGIERSRTECALGLRGVPDRGAQRLLDVEAVESRRLPCRLRRRGRGPHRRSHPLTQARGDDRALPDPSGDDRRALGHRPCARPAAAVPLAQESAAFGPEDFGFRIDHSTAGRYLWSTAGQNCWDSLARLSELGIIAGPGEFYGDAASDHVRIALTATDERIAAAAERLSQA